MSSLAEDIARGCLENGEPIEAKWGTGRWSVYDDAPDPDFYQRACPDCGCEDSYRWGLGNPEDELVYCRNCGIDKVGNSFSSEGD